MAFVDTARIFIPQPTRWTPRGNIYESKDGQYDQDKYTLFRSIPNGELANYKPFYDVIGAHYDIDVARIPVRRPYVRFMDFLHSNQGQVFDADAELLKMLAREYNVLILPNHDERWFLTTMHMALDADNKVYFQQLAARFDAKYQRLR